MVENCTETKNIKQVQGAALSQEDKAEYNLTLREIAREIDIRDRLYNKLPYLKTSWLLDS